MDKPLWAKRMAYYLEMERLAQQGRLRAWALRCSAWVDGGSARCTADDIPGHTHRYRIEDLP